MRRPEAVMSATRTEAYTDAVFAIAATILVLDLTANSIGEVSSDAELWDKLAGMWPSFVSFGVSFALLSMLWVIHVRQFHDIVRVDGRLLLLNNLRLLFIVLIPFTTSLTADYSDFYAGRMLFPINFFLAALMSHLTWIWASARGGHLLRADVAASAEQSAGGRAAVLIAAAVIPVSAFVGSWAFLLFFLNGPLTALLARRSARHGGREQGDG